MRNHASNCRRLLAGAVVILALLTGCGPDTDALAGTWEGRAADTAYVFELNPDGQGRLRTTTGGRSFEHSYRWSVRGERLLLVPERGSTASFRIMEHDEHELVVRVANGMGELCRLRRVTER
jgi:hypothetical protein